MTSRIKSAWLTPLLLKCQKINVAEVEKLPLASRSAQPLTNLLEYLYITNELPFTEPEVSENPRSNSFYSEDGLSPTD